MLSSNLELLSHRDPDCKAGFSAVAKRDWRTDQQTAVELRCWSCNTSYSIKAWSAAIDDPETENYQPPEEHRPFLIGLWADTLNLPAARPAEKCGRLLLQPERMSGWGHEVLSWLATDSDGNVLGQVDRYHTQRNAIRYRWGTWGVIPGADGFHSPSAAAKSLAAAVGL